MCPAQAPTLTGVTRNSVLVENVWICHLLLNSMLLCIGPRHRQYMKFPLFPKYFEPIKSNNNKKNLSAMALILDMCIIYTTHSDGNCFIQRHYNTHLLYVARILLNIHLKFKLKVNPIFLRSSCCCFFVFGLRSIFGMRACVRASSYMIESFFK